MHFPIERVSPLGGDDGVVRSDDLGDLAWHTRGDGNILRLLFLKIVLRTAVIDLVGCHHRLSAFRAEAADIQTHVLARRGRIKKVIPLCEGIVITSVAPAFAVLPVIERGTSAKVELTNDFTSAPPQIRDWCVVHVFESWPDPLRDALDEIHDVHRDHSVGFLLGRRLTSRWIIDHIDFPGEKP